MVEDPGSILLTHAQVPMRFTPVPEDLAREALRRPSWSLVVRADEEVFAFPADQLAPATPTKEVACPTCGASSEPGYVAFPACGHALAK